MKNEAVVKVIEGIKSLRDKARSSAEERRAAKIDSFDVRSNFIEQQNLIYRAEKQRSKEYKIWKIEQNLSDDSRKWEFDKHFSEKVLAQSSLKQPISVEQVVGDQDLEMRVVGRSAADKIYWSEKKRLKFMTEERKRRENSGAGYCTGYDHIRALELEGRLNDRALLIAYYEYLQKLKLERVSAFTRISNSLFSLIVNQCVGGNCRESRTETTRDAKKLKI